MLWYGPGAEEEATREAQSFGPLLCDPFGAQGLSKQDSREIVGHMMEIPVGDQCRSLLVGPLDRIKSSGAGDALLKTIEESPSDQVRLFLWCEDIGEVIPTIQSRTLHVWCTGSRESQIVEGTTALVDALTHDDVGTVVRVVLEHKKELRSLLESVTCMLVTNRVLTVYEIPLWDSLRGLLCIQVLTPMIVVSSLLDSMSTA